MRTPVALTLFTPSINSTFQSDPQNFVKVNAFHSPLPYNKMTPNDKLLVRTLVPLKPRHSLTQYRS